MEDKQIKYHLSIEEKNHYNRATLYGWWLLEEGTSRNVPIAGFEMILREDYKSRDEVEALIIGPEISFQTPRY